MKILLSIVILSFTNLVFGQALKKLPLVVPKGNFETKILDSAVENNYPEEVILFQMMKDTVREIKFNIFIIEATKNNFSLFSKEPYYYGYFLYEDHPVLITGNADASYFFVRTNTETTFKFLSYPIDDAEKNPIPSWDYLSFQYEYANSKFKLISGMRPF